MPDSGLPMKPLFSVMLLLHFYLSPPRGGASGADKNQFSRLDVVTRFLAVPVCQPAPSIQFMHNYVY
jgi:hypothetical protein